MATSNGAQSNGHHPAGASAQLLERLNEPRTVEALNRLLDHAELLAFSAASLDGFLQRGEVIADNLASGVAELRQALPAAAAPSSAQLGRLLQQLPHLVEVTNQLAELTARAEFQAVLSMLSNPTTLHALNRLLAHAELLATLIEAGEAWLQRGEELADNLNAGLDELRRQLPDGAAMSDSLANLSALLNQLPELNAVLPQLTAVAPRLITIFRQAESYLPRLISVAPEFIEIIEKLEPFVASAEFDGVLESGVFHRDTVRLVGRAGDAFVESYDESRRSDRRLGLIGLLRSLNDPDLQRAAGLIVTFGKRFGSSLHR